MVKIFIVRHGYSLGNEKGLITGHYDCDLAEYGIEQTKLLCGYMLANLEIDKIYSSPLCRAINTIKPVANALNLPIIQDRDFIELAVGEWDGMLYEKLIKLHPKEFERWSNREKGSKPKGGEEWEELYFRATKKIEQLIRENDNKSIVICTHGGVIKCLCSYFFGKGEDGINELDWASNASITEVWHQDGKYDIKKFSFDDYLGKIKTAFPKTV